jgi:uncharacterized protein (TIGR02996 family)
MTGRDDFLRAIRADPEDEALRLVFADWLEEQGDPLADFIRLQCELEPLGDEYGDERVKKLRRREEKVVRAHKADWLGPLAELYGDWPSVFEFRRGLVEVVCLPLQVFLDRGADVREWCPALRDLTLFEPRGRGADLASCAHLEGLAHLELADWLTPEDAEALARSPHLGRLRTLEVWVGSRHDEAVCGALARSPALAGLRELRLRQLYGGYEAEEDRTLDARADQLATAVDRLRGAPLACVERPFERRFPLRGEVGYGLYAGRLPAGRQALAAVAGRGLLLLVFDAEGGLLEVQERNLEGVLVRPPTKAMWRGYHEGELQQYLRKEFGFELGLIHVKAFGVEGDPAVHVYHHTDILENPDDPPDWVSREEDCASLHRWLEGGNFVIDWGNNYFAGPDGTIYSS